MENEFGKLSKGSKRVSSKVNAVYNGSLDGLIPVKIDASTTIYIKNGSSPEEARAKYFKRKNNDMAKIINIGKKDKIEIIN